MCSTTECWQSLSGRPRDRTRSETAPLRGAVVEEAIPPGPEGPGFLARKQLKFTSGVVESDVPKANASEIGLPSQTFRRIRLTSPFSRTVISVTNGHLPYPYGHETTGYKVANLATTLSKAKTADATVLSGPHLSGGRHSATVKFPGGYVAEIHNNKSG
jgi:hypothetical protein